jgi:hypothetical protein
VTIELPADVPQDLRDALDGQALKRMGRTLELQVPALYGRVLVGG